MSNANIQTILNFYYFDTSEPEHAQAYADLQQNTLLKLGAPVNKIGMASRTINPASWEFVEKLEAAVGWVHRGAPVCVLPVELETKHLFGDQWNSAPIGNHFPTGARLWNWTRFVFDNKSIQAGYWLTQTEEMRAALVENVKCGWCGHVEHVSIGNAFCPQCLGSEYLHPENLHLTRMLRVKDSFGGNRAELTEAEKAERMPKYRDAQIFGATERDKARIAKQRADVARDYEIAIARATMERDTKTWALDHGIRTENMIYYPHRNRVTFGWRKPLSDIEASTLLDIISEFPYPYELLCADGRNLQGN